MANYVSPLSLARFGREAGPGDVIYSGPPEYGVDGGPPAPPPAPAGLSIRAPGFGASTVAFGPGLDIDVN